jgi:hypothetical protein
MIELFSRQPKPEFDTLDGLMDFVDRPVRGLQLPSLDEFLSLQPDEQQRINELRADQISSGWVINTPQVASLVGKVEATIFANRQSPVRDSVLLTGPTTMGKTTTVLAAVRRVEFLYRQSFPDYRKHGRIPVVYVEVPPGATGKAMISRFAHFLGLPERGRETMASLENTVVDCLNAAKAELIVVDDLQRLAARSPGNVEGAGLLRSLTHRITGTFVFAGYESPGEVPLLSGHAGQQILRRSRRAEVGRFAFANEDQRAIWNGIVRAIEAELTLLNHSPGDLSQDGEWLHRRTDGRIQQLTSLLKAAAQKLLRSGVAPVDERITRDFLQTEFEGYFQEAS